MNRSSDAREYVVSAGGVGTTPVSITMNLPAAPPRKGWIYEIKLRKTAGTATLAKATIKVGTTTRAIYDDGAGGRIAIDGTGDAFHFADTRLHFTRGGAENLVIEVDCDTAGNTIEATLVVGGP